LQIFIDKHKSSTLNDLYSMIALGRPNIFCVSESHIYKIHELKNSLSNYEKMFEKDCKELPN
jgi:hypothetical protein